MKILRHTSKDLSGRGRSPAFLAGLAACLIVALPALARGGSGSGNQNGDYSSGGDETVGTLPLVGGSIHLPFTRNWRGTQPAFYLEGTADDLATVIRGARGHGFVSVQVIDPQTERLRLAFHGDVFVALVRDLAITMPIDVGIAVPASFGMGRATLTQGQSAPRIVRFHPGLLPLPVGSMLSSGTLDHDPLQILVTGRTGGHSAHTVAATADLVILGQSY